MLARPETQAKTIPMMKGASITEGFVMILGIFIAAAPKIIGADITEPDFAALAAWLKQSSHPLPNLWEQLAEPTRAKVSAFLETGVQGAEARMALAEDLNRIFYPLQGRA